MWGNGGMWEEPRTCVGRVSGLAGFQTLQQNTDQVIDRNIHLGLKVIAFGLRDFHGFVNEFAISGFVSSSKNERLGGTLS
jgi:hypothetical protein